MTQSNIAQTVRRWLRGAPRSRPFNLDLSESPSWDERAEVAVGLLAAHRRALLPERPLRIADLGCGDERLRRILSEQLSEPHEYQGYDLLPQRETVIQLDVTHSLPDNEFDVVFCLGLLEYIDPLVPFLARLRREYPAMILSYAVFDAPRPLRKRERRARGWRSHYTTSALEEAFDGVGLVCRDFRLTNRGRTGLWLLTRATPGAASGSAQQSPGSAGPPGGV
jgi:SAM-dependent methyltransferase